MKLTDLSGHVNAWFDDNGPMNDVVISSRVRLARNLAGFKFLSKCSNTEKADILEKLRKAIMDMDLGDEVFYISVDKAAEIDRSFLIERHLISQQHALSKGPRGVVIARGESFTAMINEEDHLRIQVFKGGSQLGSCYRQIDNIDDQIEAKLEYAFSPTLGYLTACPTNIGTGIRVSVMLHLPALKMIGQIEKFFNMAKDLNLSVRGLFGEGSKASGDFYQLSNQMTLGISEQQVVSWFESQVIPEIVSFENAARKKLLADNLDLLDDKISRALALLKNAHLISSQEALFLLSHLRLGINMHEKLGADSEAIRRIYSLRDQGGPISIATINRLFLLTLPAHLQINHGEKLDSNRRDVLRAQIIRSALSEA